MLKEIASWTAVVVSGIAALLWLKSASASVSAKKVADEYHKEYGGDPAQITANGVDLMQTALEQTRWNKWAAGASCVAALSQAIVLYLH